MITNSRRHRDAELKPGNPGLIDPTWSSDNFEAFLSAGRASRTLRRAPVTTQLTIPYIVLIIPQAIIHANPHLDFIVGVLALALVGALSVELLAKPRQVAQNLQLTRDQLSRYGPPLRVIALSACFVGQLSAIASATLGAGTVAAQVGAIRPISGLIPVFTLFSSWTNIGAALLVAAYLAGHVTRKSLHGYFLLFIGLELVRALITAITASLVSLTVYLVILSLFAGTIKIRHCLIAVITVLLIWPIVFNVRNEIRKGAGVTVSDSVEAYDRLRYDQQIGRAAGLPVGIDIGQPGPAEVLRYGLLPRVLDQGRPTLSTGNLINRYLGGSATSSFTFLPVTTLFVLEGPWSTIAFYALLAAVMFLAIRDGTRLSPVRLVAFGLVSSGPLDWFAGYPDSSIMAVQGFVASLPLLLLLHLARAKPTTSDAPVAAGRPRSRTMRWRHEN